MASNATGAAHGDGAGRRARGALLPQGSPAKWLRAPGAAGRQGQHLHDVVELQPCVRGGIDQDVGQGVLVVVHLICERRGKGR